MLVRCTEIIFKVPLSFILYFFSYCCMNVVGLLCFPLVFGSFKQCSIFNGFLKFEFLIPNFRNSNYEFFPPQKVFWALSVIKLKKSPLRINYVLKSGNNPIK